MNRSIGLLVLLATAAALGRVTPAPGERDTILGAKWQRLDLASFLAAPNALITPEAVNLAAQACVRRATAKLDKEVYPVASQLARELEGYFLAHRPDAHQTYARGLGQLTELLRAIDGLSPRLANSADYEQRCREIVDERFAASREGMEPLFYARMHPKAIPELERKGIRLAPLTWADLREEVCHLEGYYALSSDPRLWKLFTLSRLLFAVIPADPGEAEFTGLLARMTRVTPLLAQLNAYDGIAGKINGAAVGQKGAPEARLTGQALGSKASALLASFTTAWRDGLQQRILSRDYPRKPFELLRLNEILSSLAPGCGTLSSQTEQGMLAVWASVMPSALADPFADYHQTAALAWLALNAETGLRQNAKLAGVYRALDAPVTTAVYGAPETYARIARELQAARGAFAALGDLSQLPVPSCVDEILALSKAAEGIVPGEVAAVSDEQVRGLLEVEVPAVIADIGMEVDDKDEDGVFRLALATGAGRAVPVFLAGKTWQVWTPSAMVLHVPRVLTTAEWEGGLVEKYDR